MYGGVEQWNDDVTSCTTGVTSCIATGAGTRRASVFGRSLRGLVGGGSRRRSTDHHTGVGFQRSERPTCLHVGSSASSAVLAWIFRPQSQFRGHPSGVELSLDSIGVFAIRSLPFGRCRRSMRSDAYSCLGRPQPVRPSQSHRNEFKITNYILLMDFSVFWHPVRLIEGQRTRTNTVSGVALGTTSQ